MEFILLPGCNNLKKPTVGCGYNICTKIQQFDKVAVACLVKC